MTERFAWQRVVFATRDCARAIENVNRDYHLFATFKEKDIRLALCSVTEERTPLWGGLSYKAFFEHLIQLVKTV
jgi:predicted alpha/beta-fold hydrolase